MQRHAIYYSILINAFSWVCIRWSRKWFVCAFSWRGRLMKWRLVGLWGLLSTTLSPSTVSELPVSPHLAAAMTCQFLCCKVLRPFSQSDCTYFSVQSFQNFSLFYQLPFECLTYFSRHGWFILKECWLCNKSTCYCCSLKEHDQLYI